MARVLIVGCGCRGRGLARGLLTDGHAVRGTTRDPRACEAIEAVGVEPWVGDPNRLSTLTGALDAVTIVCWLLASACGDASLLTDLHGTRLSAYLRQMVDTTVRGFAYEAVGTVDAAVLGHGREVVAEASRTWEIPTAVIEGDPSSPAQWPATARRAIRGLLR
jgi:TrkA-N domain